MPANITVLLADLHQQQLDPNMLINVGEGKNEIILCVACKQRWLCLTPKHAAAAGIIGDASRGLQILMAPMVPLEQPQATYRAAAQATYRAASSRFEATYLPH